MSILGVKPHDDLPSNAPRGRDAERILAGELVQEIRYLRTHTTEAVERLGRRITNHVLLVTTVTIDSTGYYTNAFHVPCGCVEVTNLGSHDMTVSSAGAGSGAPTSGTGVYVVPAGAVRVVNVASRQVTIYGTTGDRLSAQFLTAGGLVQSGIVAVNGGTP